MFTKHSFYIQFGLFAILSFLVNASHAAEYWVGKDGNDSYNCTSPATPCLTIQSALDKVQPGDTVFIKEGTYTEVSDIRDGDTPVNFSLAVRNSGTINNPITITAAKNHEGKVIIDGQDQYGGIHANRHDYYILSNLVFQNMRIGSVRNYSQSSNRQPTEGKAQGWVVKNCSFNRVRAPSGVNSSHIAMWATEDWVVENNIINDSYADGSTRASGIQAYGTINAVIKNNTITNTDLGVYWKDHFVADDSFTPVVNSEISYNLIENTQVGFLIHGANEQAGFNSVHHNIFRNYTEAGVKAATKYGSSPIDPTGLTVSHNLFDSINYRAESSAIYADEYKDIEIEGNIFVRDRTAITMWQWTGEWAEISKANFNLYSSISEHIAKLDYNYGGKTFSNLASWQSATSSSATSLKVDNPDSNGVAVSNLNELFQDIDAGDYTYAAGSPALGKMPDGSNAGPYQYGTEIIGAYSGSSRPKPPEGFSITVES